MRKRLFEDPWQQRIMMIAIIGLIAIISLTLRATYASSDYGVVESEIPALHVSLKDPDSTAYHETPRSYISQETPVVVLTATEFYFGDLESFSSKFSDVRNKFYVKHVNGAPNIASLVKNMSLWIHQKASSGKYTSTGIVILLPDKNIPAPIVIQTIANLKATTYFNHVILAGGVI